MNRLSVRGIVGITKPGLHADGNGLYLNVKASGAKSWTFIYRFDKKRREIGLGSAKVVSLGTARERALAAKNLVAEGVDPAHKTEVVDVPTFGEAVKTFVKTSKSGLKTEKNRLAWEASLKNHCPTIWDRPVSEIGVTQILGVLNPIWAEIPDMARRIRNRIENVLDAARVNGHRSGDNPARWRGHLQLLLPKPKRLTRGHMAAMPHQDASDFMRVLRADNTTSARSLEFTILTAKRTVEVIGAKWNEILFEEKLWLIPGDRMKSARDYRQPLTRSALAVLQHMSFTGSDPDAYIFPGAKTGRPQSNMAMANRLGGLGYDEFTVHGFRSTFRDWAGDETDFPREVTEAALDHAVGNEVERAYRRGDALEKRRKLMEAWDQYLSGH